MLGKKVLLLGGVLLSIGFIFLYWTENNADNLSTAKTESPSSKGEIENSAEPWRPHDTMAQESSLQYKFENASDLYSLAGELEVASKNGDGQSTWMLSRIYDYCAPYTQINYGAYSEATGAVAKSNEATSGSYIQSRDRIAKRCQNFPAQPDLSYLREDAKLLAAKQENLAAQLDLLYSGVPVAEGKDYINNLITKSMTSDDPQVLLALSSPMQVGIEQLELHDSNKYLGPDAGIIWRIAACRKGLDCSARGALMTQLCANGGVCTKVPGQGYEDFVFNALVPTQRKGDVLNAVSEIIQETQGVK